MLGKNFKMKNFFELEKFLENKFKKWKLKKIYV